MNNDATARTTGPTAATGIVKRFSLTDCALLLGLVISGALLAGAHIFEAFGYAPCALCLDQREAHWTAVAITTVGLIISLIVKAPRLAAAATGTVALVYGFSMALAFYHTGVEFGFWPGPASCTGLGRIDEIKDLSAGFDLTKPRVACDKAAWTFLGISMAGYNFLVSAALFAITGLTTISAFRLEKHSAGLRS